MKILIDECTPHIVKKKLPDYDISTVQKMGWSGVKNGELIKLAEANFEILVTCDQNLRYQQNLRDRNLAIIVLPSNSVPVVEKLLPRLAEALSVVKIGDFVEIPL